MNVRAITVNVDGITLELEPEPGGVGVVVTIDDVEELRDIIKAAELIRTYIRESLESLPA